MTFPTVFAKLTAEIEKLRRQYNCDSVVCVGYNWYTADHPLLMTMCLRHDIAWPATWRWGWDPYRSIA